MATYYQMLLRLGYLTLSELHHKIFSSCLRGLSLTALEDQVEGFIEKVISKKLYFPAYESLKRAQHLGHFTALLSNSPSFLVKPLSRFFGFTLYAASEYSVTDSNHLHEISSIMDGEKKAKVLQELMRQLKIEKNEVTVYSDSHWDIPFLCAAGHPIAVKPNKKLRKVAQKNRWKILWK